MDPVTSTLTQMEYVPTEGGMALAVTCGMGALRMRR
jgi:hypothetical protein